jgi:hypothetical protein
VTGQEDVAMAKIQDHAIIGSAFPEVGVSRRLSGLPLLAAFRQPVAHLGMPGAA